MRSPRGNCLENCPVIGILQGNEEAYRQASMHDGLVAEELNHVPNASEVMMAECPLGGPHSRRFSLAKLACSSGVVEQYRLRSSYQDAEADAAADMTY